MDANERSLKRPATLALVAMVLVLVGALVWFRERVFFCRCIVCCFQRP